MSQRPALILGAGGHAHVIRSLLPRDRQVRLIEESEPGADDLMRDRFFADPPPDTEIYIGIGDDPARRRYFDRLKALGLRVTSCLAPTAWVAPDADLGEGLFLGPGAVIGSRSRIGDNVIVNTLASVDHDCTIADDVQLAPGVILGGHVRIGRRAFLGVRSCVVPRVEIGEESVVMAGAVVVRSAPGAVVIGGVPARLVRRVGSTG